MFNDFCQMASNDFEDIRDILSEMTLEDLIFHTDLILFDLDPYERINYDVNMFCNGYDDRNGRIALLEKLFNDGVISALYLPCGYEQNPELKELLRPIDYSFLYTSSEDEMVKNEPAPLTDDLEVITGQLEISNPKWEHTTDELKAESADKAVTGDIIELSADIKNYPEKASVTFDIYDVSSGTPLRITSVETKNENGIAKAKWTVEDPEKKGENLKLAFEAIARSKASPRVEVPIIPKIDCDFVEMPDILFHHNSAVPCLDQNGTLISSLASVFKFAKENSDKEIVLFGHSDTSGDPEYNYDLSQWRAEGIKALLDNKKDAWLDIVELASKVEDYQQILKSLFNHGWPTDPGKVDNANGPKTEDAVNAFQGEYNNRFNGSLKQDGVMGQNTWSALFEVIRDLLVESVKSEIGKEPSGLVYSSNNNGVYPCGESFPIDGKGKDDYKSRENRRVEIVFFDKGKAPELIKPENKKKVKKSEAVIYDKRITEKKPVFSKQVKAEDSETIVLEWVYPQVFDASKPHKQYVNLDSNGKEQGNELTIKVKAKDLKANTAGKNVYWRVTADNKNSKRNSPKTGIMDKAGGKLVEFTAGIANLDIPFEKNEASIVLACGLAGGDRFTVEAGTDGENFTSSFVVENWRKLWYQLTHHQSVTPPSMATPIEKLKTVFIEFLSETPCTHTRTATGNVIVGNHNAGEYHKLLSAKNKDRCCHIILCDKQYDGKDSTGRDLVSEATQIFESNSDFIQMSDPANKLKIFNPPLQTGSNFLVSGKWKNLAKKTNGTFTDDPTKTNLSTGLVSFHDNDFVKVDLPPNANPSATDSVEVTIKVTAACGPWGGDGSVAPHNLVVINSNDTIHSQCVMHELGHLMKMVPDPTYYLCPPGFNYADHTMQYTKMGGSGSHCSYKINKALSTKTKYVDGRCIMFHQLNNNCELIYCPDCLPFVKAQALTTLK